MASGSFSGNILSGHYTLYCEWASTASIAGNYSDVTINAYLVNDWDLGVGGRTTSFNIDGTGGSASSPAISGTGTTYLGSFSKRVYHDSYGQKTCYLGVSYPIQATISGTYYGSIDAAIYATLDNIPRYANPTQSVYSKTETSITMKWSADAVVDYIWYSKNNGSTWTGIDVADGTSGTYTITGLTANTAYNIKTRVRRRDSQLTKDTTALSVSTYAYPYSNSMPNFMIGASVTLGIYNPLKRSVTVELLTSTGVSVASWTTTGTSVSGGNLVAAVDALYQSIPNATSSRYSVRVTYGSQVSTKSGGLYTVNTAEVAPVIESVSYADVNAAIVALTGNDQDIVRNFSQVRYSAAGLASKKYATLSSVKVSVNGATINLTISGSSASGGDAVINSGSNVTATFTLTDSRGLTAQKTVDIHILDVFNPTAVISAKRHDNYYSPVDLKVDAGYPSLNGGNSVTIDYVAKCEDASVADVTGTLTDNVTSVVNLDNNYSWNITITITDLLGLTSSYYASVSRGMPIIYFDKLNSRVGINGFPTCALDIHTNGTDEDIKINNISLKEYLAKCSLDFNFPIGRIIATADSRNPSTYLGGTWVAIQDRTIVGVGTHALDWTGGQETVTLTAAQSGLPSHWHYTTLGKNTSYTMITLSANAGSAQNRYLLATGSTSTYTPLMARAETAQNASASHTNLQPSVAKYLWQRTA